MASKFNKKNLISSGLWVPENLSENKKKINKTYNIFVSDLLLSALIGIHDHEKTNKQKILINLILSAHESSKIKDDKIENVVSYEHIVKDIEKLVSLKHVGLIETLAEKISEICFKDQRVINATIKIEKLEVFDNTKSVGIQIFRERKKNNFIKKTGKILKIKK